MNREASLTEPSDISFIDVETPNRKNDRICSIGIIRTNRTGSVVDQDYILVNPEEPFDALNSGIHGLTPIDIEGCGNFADVWPRINSLLENADIVAHNASFDLSVLCKCLTAYGIEAKPFTYTCTMRLAGSLLHDLPDRKLDTICSRCGVELEAHHKAIADARACMEVFFALNDIAAIADRADLWQEYVPYAERQARRACAPAAIRRASTKAQKQLVELCKLIVEDGSVSLKEAAALHWWIGSSDALNGKTAGNLLEALSAILEDGAIDEDEEERLLATLRRIIDPATEELVGDFGIAGKKFCLTGDFDFGSKTEFSRALENAGGIACKSVTKTCDFVIIGAKGSDAYAFGNYGTKVKKAMDWQEKGCPVKIASEHDFDDLLL